MSEIPEDIMVAAREAINSAVDDRGALGVIARAILVERERCAEIVRTEEELDGDPPQHVIAAMERAGPVMNARSAVRTTKASILKRMGATQ